MKYPFATRRRFMRKGLIVTLAAVLSISSALAQQTAWQPGPGHVTLELWPHGAPGAQANSGPEMNTTTAKDRMVAGKPVVRIGNISTPTLTVYAPKDKNSGAA